MRFVSVYVRVWQFACENTIEHVGWLVVFMTEYGSV